MSTIERPSRTDGGPAPHQATIRVDEPASGSVLAEIPDTPAEGVAEIVARARAAQPAWWALGPGGRAACLRELRAWIVANRRRLVQTLMRENGKTYEDALTNELVYLGEALGYWARHAGRLLADRRIRSGSPLLVGRKVIVRHEPHGVVGIISPWNYPLNLGLGDTLTAMAAGNAVVLKPSELTPLATRIVVEEGMPAAGFPPDACLLALGAGETGAALVEEVDMIMFTGSTEVGRKILGRAGERLIPAAAELGGKDPMIVLDGADLERAANVAAFWGMSNSGQTCVSVERVYVEDAIHDAFVEKLVQKVRALRQGAPGAPGTVDVGAMTSPPQLDVVERHVRDAVDRGARVLCGGHRHTGGGEGRFFQPTVLVDVDHSMACMREETFGPTLPIMRVKDADEAVALANDLPYGLNACVFAKDAKAGERVARRVEAGNCGVNDTLTSYFAAGAPFGGWKESGLGGRHGVEGLRKFCESQTLCINRVPLKRELYHFPNRRWETALLERFVALAYGRGAKRR